jgi:DNA repair exonuclease SbcCD ATPase subunit
LRSTQEALHDLQKRHTDLEKEKQTLSSNLDHSEEMKTQLAQLKEKNESLEKDVLAMKTIEQEYLEIKAQVEPFKKQLEQFELEKQALEQRQKLTSKQLETLAAEHAKQIGHQVKTLPLIGNLSNRILFFQNHQQKIQYLVRIKTENAALVQENNKLKTELSKQAKLIEKLGGKENAETSRLERARSVRTRKELDTAKEKGVTRTQSVAAQPLGARNKKL